MKTNKKHWQKFTFNILIIFASFAGYRFIACFLSDNFFSENTGLYLFSALMQSNAAIFSILGVFYIFKLQILQSSIDMIKNILVIDLDQWTKPNWIFEFSDMSLIQKKEMYNKVNYDKYTMIRLNNWIKKEQSILTVTKNLKSPLILVAVGFILNLLGLVLSNYIHQFGVNIEFLIHYLYIILEILIITTIVMSIFKVISTGNYAV